MPKEKKETLPSGRPGRDIDMAAAVLFCASCQYLNGKRYNVHTEHTTTNTLAGQNIPVDGGYLIQVGQ